MRQLAAAFLPASLLAAFRTRAQFPASKLAGGKAAVRHGGPHSKASLRMPTEKRFSAARPDLSGQALPNPW